MYVNEADIMSAWLKLLFTDIWLLMTRGILIWVFLF